MKKIITLFMSVVFICGVKGQYVEIPDSSFRSFLKAKYPGCFNVAGQMDTTCSEINTATTLNIPQNSGIFKNVEGVQYFKSLDSLMLVSLSIDTINSLPPHIKYLDLSFNSLQGPAFPVIPNSVTHCYLQGISRAQLPPLPNSITHLDLNYSSFSIVSGLPDSLLYFTAMTSSIGSIISFPNSVKTIIIEASYWGLSLPTLPDSLIYLHTKGIATLPALPANLQTLICTDSLRILPVLPNNLRHLDLRSLYFLQLPSQFPDSLRYLNIDRNALNRQIVSLPSKLEYLSAYQSGISGTFPAMPNTLRHVELEYNSLSGFSTLSDSLDYLNFNNNQVSEIPVLPARLDTLYCWGNLYSALPPTLPTSLKQLICGNPSFSSLPPLPDGLLSLMCGTGLRSLPALPNGLRFLGVGGNRLLTSLPTLPDSLRTLGCSSCALTSLPDLPKPLFLLNCDHNPISYLPALPDSMFQLLIDSTDIRCLPKIPKSAPFNPWEYPGRLHISMDESKITCIPNLPERVNINWRDTYPICNPINNVNHCAAFPQITGTVFIDQNNNGIKDANEYPKANVKIELSNGSIAYTNNNGHFEIGADSLGSYTVTPTVPNFYNIIPASATYNFTSYDTIVSKDYTLQANTIKDSLAIKLTAINWAARPGFSFAYSVQYENAGTTTLSPNIVFEYDNTKLQYDSSSNGIVVNNGNNLSLSAGSIIPGQQQNFTVYFKVKPTTAIGDSIVGKATASANAVSASDSSKVYVRGSFDPNDKQATKQLDPQQVYNGAYIDYSIHFQNTGTDTAFNVVISDTLAPELLLNTLEVTAASHTCKTSIKDNVIFFEFLNILLPDSNVNEAKSHGFVSFKIKPHPSVPSGSYINNKAAIYFDYNVPVITNTATTFIKNFGVIPVKLISFSAVPQNDNTTALYWNTANEINCKQFVIESGNDGLLFNAITSVAAKGMASNSYTATVVDNNTGIVFYRLKMIDNDERFTYSPIIKIDRRKNTTGIAVLTNPVKDILVISTTDRGLNNTQASIINIQGAVVKTFVVKENVQTIDIKTLVPGIYYIRSINGSQKILVN